MLFRSLGSSLLLSCVATLGYCVKLLGSWILGAIKSWCAAYSAAEVVGVLPEGYWTFSTVMLGVLALSKEVVLGVVLRAVEYLIRCVAFVQCVAYLYSKLARVRLLLELLGIGFAARYWSATFKRSCWGGS